MRLQLCFEQDNNIFGNVLKKSRVLWFKGIVLCQLGVNSLDEFVSLYTERPTFYTLTERRVGTFGDPPNLTLTHLTRRLTLKIIPPRMEEASDGRLLCSKAAQR